MWGDGNVETGGGGGGEGEKAVWAVGWGGGISAG